MSCDINKCHTIFPARRDGSGAKWPCAIYNKRLSCTTISFKRWKFPASTISTVYNYPSTHWQPSSVINSSIFTHHHCHYLHLHLQLRSHFTRCTRKPIDFFASDRLCRIIHSTDEYHTVPQTTDPLYFPMTVVEVFNFNFT